MTKEERQKFDYLLNAAQVHLQTAATGNPSLSLVLANLMQAVKMLAGDTSTR